MSHILHFTGHDGLDLKAVEHGESQGVVNVIAHVRVEDHRDGRRGGGGEGKGQEQGC